MQQLKNDILSVESEEYVDLMNKNATMGYMLASNSLSKFCGKPVFSRRPKIDFNHFSPDLFKEVISNYQGDECYVLITDVIGAISCKSFLILSNEDAVRLADFCKEANGIANIPLDELLKEVDNIVSAGLVSCFSKIMEMKIFGGVPQLIKLKKKDVHSFIEGNIQDFDFDINDYESFMVVSSVFGFAEDKSLAPMFVWVFPDEFYKKMS